MADVDTLPTPGDPTGPCPRCGRTSNFRNAGQLSLRQVLPLEMVTSLICAGCEAGTVVVETLETLETPETADWRPLHWWPTPGAGQLDPAVPAAVASTYDEGMRCLAVAALRGAVVMFRGTLDEIASDKGASAQAKSSLHDRLATMATAGTLPPSLVEWAKEIRVLGNVGAHPSSLGTVTAEEATGLGQLVRQMIAVLYETPARIERLRAARGGNP